MIPRPILAALIPLASLLALMQISPDATAATTTTATPPVPQLAWTDCGDGFECATARVPLDYDRPHGETIELPLIRKPASDPAHRIGHLFFHQGGSGRNVEAIRAFPPFVFDLFSRFDFIGFDNRGVGGSQPALVACGPHPAFVSPFPTPQSIDERAFLQDSQRYTRRCERRNRELLSHLSSANIARDLDLMRAAVGDDKLTYFGVSFGTTVGATYASLFPGRARALLLDSAMDVEGYLRRPITEWREYAASHEEVLQRFLAACAANPDGCGFGGSDPERALDRLLARLERQPMSSSEGILTAEHVRIGMTIALRRRILWPVFSAGLAQAEAGDPTLLLDFVGSSIEPNENDDFLTALYAVDQDYPRLPPFAWFKLAERSYADFPHFWFASGYPDLVHALWPVEDRSLPLRSRH
jgi:pimeloyl-ACP methyl ester carboxylesterase